MAWKTGVLLSLVVSVVCLASVGHAQNRSPFEMAADFDGDGVCDPGPDQGPWKDLCGLVNEHPDNCVKVSNPDQADQDGDGIGDACDSDFEASSDTDHDGLADCLNGAPFDLCPPPPADLVCPQTGNTSGYTAPMLTGVSAGPDCQVSGLSEVHDTDGDGIGDACDLDIDGDGFNNDADCDCLNADILGPDADGICASSSPNPDDNTLPLTDDQDQDGLPDFLETMWGVSDPAVADTDGDGIDDKRELLELGSDPSSVDSDGDGICDGNPTVAANTVDCTPGPDNCVIVPNPNQEDQDGNQVGDRCQGDHDGDGFSDDQDNCPLVYNPSQLNSDSHPLGDACQPFLAGSVFDQSGSSAGGCQLTGRTATPVSLWSLLGICFSILIVVRSKRFSNV